MPLAGLGRGLPAGRVAACLARGEVHGTAPDLDDGGLYRGVW